MPYNPGIQARGDQYLFAGLAGAGRAVGDAIDEHKQRSREFKALQEFADVTGIADKNQTTPLGLDALRGMVRAVEYKRGLEESGLRNDYTRAQMRNLDADNARASEAASALKAFQGAQVANMDADNARAEAALRDEQRRRSVLAQFVQGFNGAPTPLNTSGRIQHALRSNPDAATSPQFAEIVKALGAVDPSSESYEPRVVTKTDEAGKLVRFAMTGPKQSQVLPGDEMTVGEKRQYATSLQAQRRQFLVSMSDPLRADMKDRFRSEIEAIDQELQELGFGRSKATESPTAEPKKLRRVYNPKTGKVEEVK